MSDKEDGEVLSEGELEDGELPSSDEEEDTTKDKEPVNLPKSPPGSQAESDQSRAAQKRPLAEEEAGAAEKLKPDQKKPKLDASPITDNTDDAEDGEIFSDDEEAAYYPQLVKSRPSENQTNSENKAKSGGTATLSQDERRWGRRRRDSIEEKCGENIYVATGYHNRRDKSPLDYDDFEDREENKSSDNDSSGRERDRDKKRDYHNTSSKSYSKSSRYTSSRDRDSDYDDQEDGESSRGQYSYKGRKGYGGGRFYQNRQQRYSGRNTRQWDQNQSRGGGYGGYGTQPAPGQMNTGMTARQFHFLASKVAKRRERGLSLLPNPDVPICNNLDQFNYPAPPSWYLDAVESWEKKMKEREESSTGKELAQETSISLGGDGAVSSTGENRAASPDPKTLPSLMQLPLNLPLQQPFPLVQEAPSSQQTVVQPVNEVTPVELSDEVHQPPEDMDIEVSSQDEEEEINQQPPKDLNKGDKDEDEGDSRLSRPLPRKSIDSEQDVDDFDYDMYLDQLVDEEEEDESGSGPALDSSTGNPVTNKADSTTNPSLKSLFAQDHPSIGQANEDKGTDVPHVKLSDQSLLKEGVNPLNEDFPLIDPSNKAKVEVGVSQNQSGPTNQSLKALVGQDIDMVVAADEGKEAKDGSRRGGVKSNRRKQKETVWWAKQKEKETLASKRAEETAKIPCKYFVAGFCKHGDNCQYSHNITREKKKDICKFYLQDSCTKGDDCLYYHGAFPCKFYHTKTYCKHGDKCRFSHAPLTPETRDLLMTVLEPSKDLSKLPELPVTIPSPATGIPTMIPALGSANVLGGHAGSLQPYTDHQRQHAATPMSSVPTIYPTESRQPKDGHWSGAGSSVEPNKLDGEGGEGFIVSIPKHIASSDGLIVSIPLSKVRTKVQNVSGNVPPSLQSPQPTHGVPQFLPAQPQVNTFMYQPPPQRLPHVIPQPPVPFQFQQTGIGIPQQTQPVPLFPPKTTSPTTGFPPNLNPPDGSSNLLPPFQQRKGLLPTPPPHFKLTPEDLKRMETTKPEYWEAPELSQYGQPQPQPPQYGQTQPQPPQYGQPQPQPSQYGQTQPQPPQYGQPQPQPSQYGQTQPQPPQYGQPQPQPPQYGQPQPQPPQYGQPQPQPSQYGQPQSQPPQYGQPQLHPPQYGQLQPQPPQYGQPQPHLPQGTQFPAQAQENYTSAPPPGGVPTAPDPYSMALPSRLPPPPLPVREDPRQDVRQLGADPRQTRPADFRPMEPHPPNSTVVPPDPRAFARPQLHVQAPNMPQPGTNPVPGPRVGMERGQHPSMSSPPIPSFQPPQHQTVGFPVPPHGLSSSFGGGGDFQHAQTHAYPHSQPPPEGYSSVWSSTNAASPERPATTKPEVVTSSPADPRRIDPRTKYAHLKIKPKNQSSHPSSHSILKKGQVKGDKSPDKTDKPFTIPKLLQDPSALEKPLDPCELFSGSTEAGQEYGEIRAPFGTFGSYFSRAQEGSLSPKGSHQQFGEITLNVNTKHKAEERIPEKESPNQKESPTPQKDVSSPTKPHVPSYFAQLELELDSDLKIDSAFSSLEEKSKGEDGSGADSKQKLDAAKKLPNIFGFGL